jgi:RNA polymerase-binding transcription factor DksA
MSPKRSLAQQPYTAGFLDDRRRDLGRARAWLVSDLRLLGETEAGSGSPFASAVYESGALALSAAELAVSPRASAKALLHEVDDALARMEAGLYGWDPAAGRWIRPDRLAAVPTARHDLRLAPGIGTDGP